MKYSLRSLLVFLTVLCVLIGGYRFLFTTKAGLASRARALSWWIEPEFKSMTALYGNAGWDSCWGFSDPWYASKGMPHVCVRPESLSVVSRIASWGGDVRRYNTHVDVTFNRGPDAYGIIIGKLPYWARESIPLPDPQRVTGPVRFSKAENLIGDIWLFQPERSVRQNEI